MIQFGFRTIPSHTYLDEFLSVRMKLNEALLTDRNKLVNDHD